MTKRTAIPASQVTGSVGVNTHIDFKNFGYQNLQPTIDAIKFLGVKLVRDCPGNDSDLTGARAWSVVAKATGCIFLPFIGETDPASADQQLGRYPMLNSQGIIDMIEGPNEWDDAYPISRGTSLPLAAAFQQKVWDLGQKLKLPVVNISFGSGWVPPLYHGNYDKVGDLSAVCDYANAHTYPTVGSSVESVVQRLNGLAHMAAASKPVIATEIGFNGSQFPDEAEVARKSIYCVLDGVLYGNPRSYFYALFDDGSGKFGFFHPDYTPKQCGVALHNFMAIMRDAGAAPGDSLDYALAGSTNDRSFLMQKADGTFWLALWNEKDATHTTTVTFASQPKSVAIYDPINGTSPTQTINDNNSLSPLSVSLGNHPLLIMIDAAGTATVPTQQTPTDVSITPTSMTFDATAKAGDHVCQVKVATSDGQAFGGTVKVDAPFDMSGMAVIVKDALPTGPASLSATITASAGGVDKTTTLSASVADPGTPPAPVQEVVGITLSPAAPSIADTVAVGATVCSLSVQTKDGQPFTGTTAVDAPFAINGGNVVVKDALPQGPVTLHVSVKAGDTFQQPLDVSVTHAVVTPPTAPAPVITPNPKWGPPDALAFAAGKATRIGGIAISDQWAVGHKGEMSLGVSVASGAVAMTDKAGNPVAGSGTKKIKVSVNFDDANAMLATLVYTGAAAGKDTLTLDVYDQAGIESKKTIPITIV